jgi:hypothetical protein
MLVSQSRVGKHTPRRDNGSFGLSVKLHGLYFIMILLSIYIYNWIGNKFLQLTSPSPYKYINSINKTNLELVRP